VGKWLVILFRCCPRRGIFPPDSLSALWGGVRVAGRSLPGGESCDLYWCVYSVIKWSDVGRKADSFRVVLLLVYEGVSKSFRTESITK
jgi:hypothetical protein